MAFEKSQAWARNFWVHGLLECLLVFLELLIQKGNVTIIYWLTTKIKTNRRRLKSGYEAQDFIIAWALTIHPTINKKEKKRWDVLGQTTREQEMEAYELFKLEGQKFRSPEDVEIKSDPTCGSLNTHCLSLRRGNHCKSVQATACWSERPDFVFYP